jgi:hypothetical protein
VREVGLFPWIAIATIAFAWVRRPEGRVALAKRLAIYSVGVGALLWGSALLLGIHPPPGRLAAIAGLQLAVIVPVIVLSDEVTAGLSRLFARMPPRASSLLAVGLGQVGVFALALPLLTMSISLRRANGESPPPAYALGHPVIEAPFEGHGGTRLAGAWIHAPERRGVVLLVHGLTADRSMFLPALEPLAARGFDVFTFDQRGHGASEGHTTTLGAIEQHDVRAAWNEVLARTRGESIPRVAVGISLGGAALQLAAPGMEQLDGMVLDSTFAHASAPARRRLPLPPPLDALAFGLARLVSVPLLGHSVLDLAPVDSAGKNGPNYPVAVVHARGDGLIPYEEAIALRDAYGPRAKLFTIEAATHPATFAEPQVYERALRHAAGL